MRRVLLLPQAQTNKLVIVACMNRAVHAFHTKGKKAYSLYMPAPVVVMELVSVQRARMVKALIVALGSGEARTGGSPCILRSP